MKKTLNTWGCGLVSAIPVGLFIWISFFLGKTMNDVVTSGIALNRCEVSLLELLVQNDLAKRYSNSSSTLYEEDLRDGEYPPMTTKWPVSKTFKFFLNKPDSKEVEELFGVCKHTTNSSNDNLGVISIQIFKEFPFSN